MECQNNVHSPFQGRGRSSSGRRSLETTPPGAGRTPHMPVVRLVCLAALAGLPILANGRSVLAIGDSVDRFMCEDWCAYRGSLPNCAGAECTYWMEGILKHGIFPTTSMLCNITRLTHDTVAFVQIYGSPDNPPYFKDGNKEGSRNHYNSDNYVATPARIGVAIDGHFRRIGAPDIVVFNSVMWDVTRLYEQQGTWNNGGRGHGDYDLTHSAIYNSSVLEFEINMRKRIVDIENSLARNLNITYSNATIRQIRDIMGLRTGVYNKANGPLVHAFNNVVRSLCSELQLTLYDYDRDLWGDVGFNVSLEKELLRDFIHPIKHYTALAAEKLLLNRFSSQLTYRVSSKEFLKAAPRPWWRAAGGPRPPFMMQVLVTSEGLNHSKVFYLRSTEDHEIIERFDVPHMKPFLRMMRLGPSDILGLSTSNLTAIPLGPPVPPDLVEEDMFLNWLNAKNRNT